MANVPVIRKPEKQGSYIIYREVAAGVFATFRGVVDLFKRSDYTNPATYGGGIGTVDLPVVDPPPELVPYEWKWGWNPILLGSTYRASDGGQGQATTYRFDVDREGKVTPGHRWLRGHIADPYVYCTPSEVTTRRHWTSMPTFSGSGVNLSLEHWSYQAPPNGELLLGYEIGDQDLIIGPSMWASYGQNWDEGSGVVTLKCIRIGTDGSLTLEKKQAIPGEGGLWEGDDYNLPTIVRFLGKTTQWPEARILSRSGTVPRKGAISWKWTDYKSVVKYDPNHPMGQYWETTARGVLIVSGVGEFDLGIFDEAEGIYSGNLPVRNWQVLVPGAIGPGENDTCLTWAAYRTPELPEYEQRGPKPPLRHGSRGQGRICGPGGDGSAGARLCGPGGFI